MSKVAVVTPIYATRDNGRAELFEDTLKSMIRLPDDFLHLIVDDGSPNQEGIREVVCGYPDDRIRYIRRERKPTDRCTASNALNFGINSILNGEQCVDAVTFLHSDDIMLDLGERLRAIQEGACAVTSRMIRFAEHYAFIQNGENKTPQELVCSKKYWNINFHTLMWSRDILMKMREFNMNCYGYEGVFLPNIAYGEDGAVTKLTLLTAMIDRKYFPNLNVVSVGYRTHHRSISGTIPFNEREADLRIVDSVYFPSPRSGLRGINLLQIFNCFVYEPFFEQYVLGFKGLFGRDNARHIMTKAKRELDNVGSLDFPLSMAQEN